MTGVDVIIQQHSSQVEQLNEQLQRAREQQENLIKEKVRAKRHQKEMYVSANSMTFLYAAITFAMNDLNCKETMKFCKW